MFEKLFKLLGAMIAMMIVALIILTYALPMPVETARVIEEADVPGLAPKDVPCLLTCYTTLEGDEKVIFKDASFLKVENMSDLITYFPCNEHITFAAALAIENGRWKNPLYPWGNCPKDTLLGFGKRIGLQWGYKDVKDTDGDGFCELIPSDDEAEKQESQQDRAFRAMYDCITGDVKCELIWGRYSMSDFCEVDDYLKGFPTIPCWSTMKLGDLVDPHNFAYKYRSGKDIANNFRCTRTTYSLCTKSMQYSDDCQPAWALLDKLDPSFGGDTEPPATGRCEDFTILHYALFRAVGTSPSELPMKVQYCDLPCPCKRLFERCPVFNVTLQYCYTQSFINPKGKGWIPGCMKGVTRDMPKEFYGSYLIESLNETHETYFQIKQSQDPESAQYSAFNYSLTFDGVDNEIKSTCFFDYDGTLKNYRSKENPCFGYGDDYTLSELALACERYLATDINIKPVGYELEKAGFYPSIVMLLTFDEGEGNEVYDYSGHANSGLVYGDALWEKGIKNTALSFDGSDDSVLVYDSDCLHMTDAVTVSAWVNYDSNSEGYVFIKGANAYGLNVTSGKLVFFVKDSGGTIHSLQTQTSYDDNKWHHVLGTYNKSAGMKLFVDSVLASSNADSFDAYNDEYSASIGSGGIIPDRFFSGLIDEVAVLNISLSEDEASYLYKSQSLGAGTWDSLADFVDSLKDAGLCE